MAEVNLPSTPKKGDKTLPGHGAGHEIGHPRMESSGPKDPALVRRIFTGLIQCVLAIALIGAGYLGYRAILDSAPKAERKPPQRIARLVEVTPAERAATGPMIEAWGEVVAAQTLAVRPEISGTLEWVHPDVTPGGRLSGGQEVARFDDDDLKLALAQAENAVAQIDARILIERGQGEIGKRELRRLSRNLTEEQRALVLREPQMASLLAERAAADAVLQQARNALARAVVRAPFDALVLSEDVAPGAMLTQGAEAARLVASDRFHVTLAVPASALQWLRFDGTQNVTLTQPGIWPDAQTREGRILRLNSALTATGRMVEVIVEIPDPLALKSENSGKSPVLLGSFVRGVVTAERIAGALQLDRAYLRDGDTVWVMDDQDKLQIRNVTVVWRGPSQVLLTDGLAPGDRVVTTTLATFAPGMALRVRKPEADKTAEATEKGAKPEAQQ